MILGSAIIIVGFWGHQWSFVNLISFIIIFPYIKCVCVGGGGVQEAGTYPEGIKGGLVIVPPPGILNRKKDN